MVPVKHSDTCLDKAHTIPQNYILSEDRLQESQLKMLSFGDVPKQEHDGGTEDGVDCPCKLFFACIDSSGSEWMPALTFKFAS